jgi:hypothetical protein
LLGDPRAGEVAAIPAKWFSPDPGTTAFEDATWMSSLDGVLGTGYQVIAYKPVNQRDPDQ